MPSNLRPDTLSNMLIQKKRKRKKKDVVRQICLSYEAVTGAERYDDRGITWRGRPVHLRRRRYSSGKQHNHVLKYICIYILYL